jgi:hypothetical protein
MSAIDAKDWMLVVGLAVGVLAGAAMLVVSVNIGWITKKIAVLTLVYGVAGGCFVLSPKWSELFISWDKEKFEAKISQLENEMKSVKSENEALSAQVTQVASLSTQPYKSAADYIGAWDRGRMQAGWANYIPADASSIRIEALDTNAGNLKTLAEKLGMSPEQVLTAVREAGFLLLTNATRNNLETVPPDYMWLRPVTVK